MKKHKHTEMSDRVCSACQKPLKLNVVERKPNAHLCYKDWQSKEKMRRNRK
jgi:hypothetical protein